MIRQDYLSGWFLLWITILISDGVKPISTMTEQIPGILRYSELYQVIPSGVE